jgi:hypothetical protein
MFTFKLELETGEPAEPAKFVTAVPGWVPGDANETARGDFSAPGRNRTSARGARR